MDRRILVTVTAFSALAAAAADQVYRRSAMVRGGGGPGGRCTVEVVVDGAAEVDIRGASATLRNLSGQPPQWRRFECTSPLPANPVDFRFSGVDGRGRQELIRDPRNGGAAVVRIEDPDNGAEGYTFDLTWGDRGWQERDRGLGSSDRPGREALRSCQRAVEQKIRHQGYQGVEFQSIRVDDRPGRSDMIIGSARGNGEYRLVPFDFSCAVDLRSGEIRSVVVRGR
jgi:hypothetical protein